LNKEADRTLSHSSVTGHFTILSGQLAIEEAQQRFRHVFDQIY